MADVKQLYPFQEEGVAFFRGGRRRYLADEMGLGKSVQAAAAAEQLNARNILVIAPASSLENWRREWAKWGSHGDFTALSYASSKLHDRRAQGEDWDLVILDEAHYAKNPRAKRSLAALNVARAAPRSWLLSGTPMPNHPGELWPPIRALWPGIPAQLGLESYDDWFNFFCRWTRTRYGRRVFGVRNKHVLRKVLDKIMLRRTIDDVELQLPELRVDVHLLPRDAGFDDTLAEAGIDPAALRAALDRELADEDGSLSRARQFLGQYKAPMIAHTIADELESGQYRQVVVMAYHHDVLDTLGTMLDPYGVVGFRGDTPQARRQEAIDTFTNDPTYRVFLAQQTAAGVAINLQTASEVVLVEPAWTPDENRQAIKRIHRIGQKRPCRARLFGVAGTLDEAIMSTVAQKTRMQRDVGLTPEGGQ